MSTIRDVAQLAGVSVSTVSRVLNENGYVKEETDRKVKEAIKKLRYEPNAMARSLISKKTGTIALVIPDITNPFFPELTKAVEDIARLHGYAILFCNSNNDARSYISLLEKRYIDGIIYFSLKPGEEERLIEKNIPFVVLDRAPNNENRFSVIKSKNREGARKAVEHLLEIGCKKIAHIYGPQEFITAKERLDGYLDVVSNKSWYSPTLLVPGNFKLKGGMEAAKQILECKLDVDGIFVGNDLMAVGVIKTLIREGIKIPEQIAVCGFDGINLGEAIEPELTSIAQPIYQLGSLAATVLIEKLKGINTENKTYHLDVELKVRGSTQRR